ncbi:MAG: HAD hydrolase family protein [Verrucomicrobiae bacterium]|nr:HAD hydrolase family protein [Verrucomicrobiae bacterium]
MPIRLVSTDFDGTIHEDFAHAPVPDALQDRLLDLQAQGVSWVINTGRDLASLMESIGRARLRVRPDFVVTVEREIHRHVGGHYESVEPWNADCVRDHAGIFDRHAPALADLAAGMEERFDATFYSDMWSPICVIARTNPQMDAIQSELETFCRSVPELVPVRNDVYVRLSHRAYSKGTALQQIQRLLGVGPGESFAAGDHLNDLPMLRREVAHWLATPANGLPQVRDQVAAEGGYLAAAGCGLGVLEALDHFARLAR